MTNKQKVKMLICFFVMGIILVLLGIFDFAHCVVYGGIPYLLFIAIPGFIFIVIGCGLLTMDYYGKKSKKDLN